METRRAWIDSLPDELSLQRRLLAGFIDWCESEPSVRWAFLGCSLARGAGDPLSDLDLSIGVTPGEIEPRLRAALGGLASLVECFMQEWPARVPVHRYFAQYEDRSQIDLTVSEAAGSTHLIEGVVLYDPDGLVEVVGSEVLEPTATEVRAWACNGWEALLNLGKYVRRGSLWEARHQLEEARRRLFQLWGFAEGVPQSRYGVTALYDAEPARFPPGIEHSHEVGDPAALVGSARALAGALLATAQRLEATGVDGLPDALGRFAVADLGRL